MQLDIMVESKVGAAACRELGLLAEQYGFRAMWVQNYARAPDAFMTAVPLAMASSRIRVGVCAVSAYELHPLRIANAVLTLNELCAGGACVVIGAGGEWPGVMNVPLGKRITGAREAIEIVRRAAHEGKLTYKGEVYKAQYFSTAWAGKAEMPLIYAGATGPKMINMATAVADGLMMSDVQPEMFDWPMPNLQAALAARDPSAAPFRINNFLSWHVKEDAAASYAEARRELMIRGWLERQWVEPFLRPDEAQAVLGNTWPFLKAFRERHGDIDGVDPAVVQRLVDGLTCAGGLDTLDRHIERLRRFKAAGFTEIALGLQDDPADAIRLLGEHVLPALQ